MSDFKDTIKEAVKKGILLDTCGEITRYYDYGAYVDLCGMDPEDILENMRQGGTGGGGSSKTSVSLSAVVTEVSEGVWKIVTTSNTILPDTITLTFTIDGEPKTLVMPAGSTSATLPDEVDKYCVISATVSPTSTDNAKYSVNSTNPNGDGMKRLIIYTYKDNVHTSVVNEVKCGTQVSLSANNIVGFTFDKWEYDTAVLPDATVSNNVLTFTMPDIDEVEVSKKYKTMEITLTINITDGTYSVDKQPVGGKYKYGDIVTVTVTPNEGYKFVKWSDNNTKNPRTITLKADTIIESVCEIKQFTLSVNTVKGDYTLAPVGGTYDYGTSVIITINPNEHYHFVKWNDDDINNPRTVIVTSDISLSTECEIDTFIVSVNLANYRVAYGTKLSELLDTIESLIPTDPDHQVRVSTINGAEVDENTILNEGDVIVSEVKNIMYSVVFRNYDGTILQEAVSGLPFGAAITYDGVTPTKTLEGYTCTFNGWNPTFVPGETTVSGNMEFIALFIDSINSYEIKYFVSMDGAEPELLSALTQTVVYGSTLRNHEKLEEIGIDYTEWTPNLEEIGTMPAYDINVYCTGISKEYYLTVIPTVEGDEQYYDLLLETEDGRQYTYGNFFHYGEKITITATIKEGMGDKYGFNEYGDNQWQTEYTIQDIDDNKVLVPAVVGDKYTVYYEVDGSVVHSYTTGYGQTIPEYTYEAGEGYIVGEWQGLYTEMPDHDFTATTTVSKVIYTLTVETSDQNYGLIQIEGDPNASSVSTREFTIDDVNSGNAVNISAVTNGSAYGLTNWTNGEEILTGEYITVNYVLRNMNITANFYEKEIASINTAFCPYVTLVGYDETVNHYEGETLTFTVTAKQGCVIDSKIVTFNGNNYELDENNQLTVTLSSGENILLVESHEIKYYSVTLETEPSISGTLSIDYASTEPVEGKYIEGTMFEFKFAPNEGYEIQSWIGVDSYQDNISKIMDLQNDVTVKANAQIITYEVLAKVDDSAHGNVTIESDKPLIDGKYQYGSKVTITFNPSEGYKLVNWNGSASLTDNPIVINKLTSDANYEAMTAIIVYYTVNASVDDTTHGNITLNPLAENKRYSEGSDIDVVFTAESGFKLKNWLINNVEVTASTNTYRITNISEDMTIQAITEEATVSNKFYYGRVLTGDLDTLDITTLENFDIVDNGDPVDITITIPANPDFQNNFESYLAGTLGAKAFRTWLSTNDNYYVLFVAPSSYERNNIVAMGADGMTDWMQAENEYTSNYEYLPIKTVMIEGTEYTVWGWTSVINSTTVSKSGIDVPTVGKNVDDDKSYVMTFIK